jgi:uncharacterized phiE125 gp8 family phage protein
MQVITPPTLEAITLADIKSQLGIKTAETGSDSTIIRRIAEAREYAEEHTQRSVLRTLREIRFDKFPQDFYYEGRNVYLPFPNLLSVESVKYIDSDGVEQTISAADYTVDTYSKQLPYVRPNYGTAWPYARIESNAVRIRYYSGYDSRAIAAAKTVTAATNASPGVFTSAGHGYENGDVVLMTATGMTQIDGNCYRIINKATDTFQLADLSNTYGISTVSYGVFAACTVQKVELNVPQLFKEALMLLVGFWMNNQPQSENGLTLSRVPYAVRDLLDKYSVVRYV